MICVANWKMNMSLQEAQKFLFKFKNFVKEEELQDFVFLPPALLSGLFQKENLLWGAQNIYKEKQGAFTGENSPQTFQEMGAQFCLLGHSERRYNFGESDVDIEKKFRLSQELGLIPILCIGEMPHEKKDREIAFKRQLNWLKTYNKYQDLPWHPEKRSQNFQTVPFILAYEPVWAIGTGETPSPHEINEAHHFIREYLPFENLSIFYGGSVTKENAASFAEQDFIDGFLIGGASLKPEEFYSIYKKSQG